MGYPRSIFFIIGNEFCERFSFYGLRAVLPLYLRSFPGVDENRATSLFATFTVFCYLFPLFGGILSDSYLGKYKTILYLSLTYCAGNIINALFAIPNLSNGTPWGCAIGLFLVALGTGGIKPCVSAFGGDQFGNNQEKELATFFFIFYFSINSGSLLATFATPLFRRDVSCFGGDCFPLAFGVPAILMVVAVIFFISGRNKYKIIAPKGSIVLEVIKIVWCALKAKVSRRGQYAHWLDAAKGDFDEWVVEDVKALSDVLFIFLPIPIFWSLYDQQSTRWTFQAERMNRTILSGYEIAPDQIQVFGSFLVLVLVPFFNRVVYVLFEISLLRRMSIGMFLASLAFVASGVVELANNNAPEPISVFLQVPQYFLMTSGEIMVSITGLEYAYSQSPNSMKSVCQAAWLMTISIGNIVVLTVAETRFFDQWAEFFAFASLMFLTMCLFIFMSTRVTKRNFQQDLVQEALIPETEKDFSQ